MWNMKSIVSTFAVLLLAGGASAQEQGEPHSEVVLSSEELSVELAGSQSINLTIQLNVGVLQCTEDFEIGVDVHLASADRVQAQGATATLAFERDIVVVGYPYNYRSEAQIPFLLEGPISADETVSVVASYDGTVPSQCVTTGTMPSAQDSIEINITSPPPVESETAADAPGPETGDPPDGEAANESPSPALLLLISGLIVIAGQRRRRA